MFSLAGEGMALCHTHYNVIGVITPFSNPKTPP